MRLRWRGTGAPWRNTRMLHRFSEIFKTMGLPAPTAELLLAEPGLPGVTREIT